MPTCWLKRILPFMLTLAVGLALGSFFRSSSHSPQFTTWHTNGRGCYQKKNDEVRRHRSDSESTPLSILFEPPTRMTETARAKEIYGVVKLLVEYGADGKARVLERLWTLPDGLTEQAESVVERTQFRPETRNGTPVSVTRVQEFYFHAGRF